MTRDQRLYLDHNATSPLRPEARAAMIAAFDQIGNPSSVHQEGRKARAILDAARDAVADLCGGSARDVIFTSGGTEAISLGLTPSLLIEGDRRPFTHCLITRVEHACVLQGHRFGADHVRLLEVDGSGLVQMDGLSAQLEAISAQNGRALVALQAANSETGVLQPIGEASQIVHAHGGIVLCDAVQVAGKLPLDQVTAGADMVALSAHKIGGPQGVGALVLRSGGISIGDKMLRGGGQERGARAGTENVAGIAGFGAAARAVLVSLVDHIAGYKALQEATEEAVLAIAPDAMIFGKNVPRLPNTLAFAVRGLTAETALMGFDLGGIALSSGSACSSGKVKASHVLEAMAVAPDMVAGALRVSFGWTNTAEDVIRFASVFETVMQRLKVRSRAA
jgi:cysteine desulfurase